MAIVQERGNSPKTLCLFVAHLVQRKVQQLTCFHSIFTHFAVALHQKRKEQDQKDHFSLIERTRLSASVEGLDSCLAQSTAELLLGPLWQIPGVRGLRFAALA